MMGAAPRKLQRPRNLEPARKTTSNLAAATMLDRFARYQLTDLVLAVSSWTGVAPLELVSGNRSARVTRGRSWLYVALRRRGWSWTDIGAMLDRDHSTCIYGARYAEGHDEMGRFVAHLAEKAPENPAMRAADAKGGGG